MKWVNKAKTSPKAQGKKVLVNIFAMSNFNYCSLA